MPYRGDRYKFIRFSVIALKESEGLWGPYEASGLGDGDIPIIAHPL